jgi:argininosuccinate lyase
LPLSTLQSESSLIGADVFDVLTLDGSVNARNHPGGTAPAQVVIAITEAQARLDAMVKGSLK